jgi:hypothetical protein
MGVVLHKEFTLSDGSLFQRADEGENQWLHMVRCMWQ